MFTGFWAWLGIGVVAVVVVYLGPRLAAAGWYRSKMEVERLFKEKGNG